MEIRQSNVLGLLLPAGCRRDDISRKDRTMKNTHGISHWWIAVSVILASGFSPFVAARADEDGASKKHRVDMSAVPPDVRDEHVNLRSVNDKIEEGFKIRRSLHYSIIYNTSEEDVAAFEYAIEKTYRACAKWCISMGIDIHPPKQKMPPA